MESYRDILDQHDDTALSSPELWEHAGFWVRLAALVIDGIILYILRTIISFSILATADPNSLLFSVWLSVIVNSLVVLLYYILLESGKNQATLGKMALGIRVVDQRGERITVLRAIARYFARILSTLTLLIGYFMAGFTQNKQALHDLICSTYVIRR